MNKRGWLGDLIGAIIFFGFFISLFIFIYYDQQAIEEAKWKSCLDNEMKYYGGKDYDLGLDYCFSNQNELVYAKIDCSENSKFYKIKPIYSCSFYPVDMTFKLKEGEKDGQNKINVN